MVIGIIDSGKGGEYFENRIHALNPYAQTIRYSPRKFETYSNISIEKLCTVSSFHINYINNNLNGRKLECIVVACMTLSSNCLEFIKSQVNVPVYDMLTCLPYITNDTTVFATPNTIKSNRFSYCVEVPCSKLSSDIELNKDSSFIKLSLKEYINNLNIVCTPKILLGCSHYSIIKNHFQTVFNPIEIIDPIELLLQKF